MQSRVILSLTIILSMVALVSAADLTLTSGQNITLGGGNSYGVVFVASGSYINVNGTIGYLNLTATTNITIMPGAWIIGTANGNGTGGGGGSPGSGGSNGQNGGQGVFSLGNGAGFGGGGGDGCASSPHAGSGGSRNDTPGTINGRYEINETYVGAPSSGGGGGGSGNNAACGNPGGNSGTSGGNGGKGGAVVYLYSPNIYLWGGINSSGAAGGAGGTGGSSPDGTNDGWGGGGAGGASGGQIIIDGTIINMTGANLTTEGGIKGSGGNGGGSSSASRRGTDGQGGAGGRIKIFYGTLYNNSINLSVLGGDQVINGTIHWNQTNQAPQINQSGTVPTTILLNSTNNYLNVTVYDLESNGIPAINFTLTGPNGTTFFNNINGTRTGSEWHSPTFNVSSRDGFWGQWNWSVITLDSQGASQTFTYSFTVNDTTAPTINITWPTNNTISYRNKSIELNFTITDNVNISWCGFSLNGGITNTTISNCINNNSLVYNHLNGTYNLTVWANDSSNNLASNKISNFTIINDTTAPIITINNPSGILTSNTFLVNISLNDSGGVSSCYFNITRGASTEVANTSITNLSTVTTSVSGDASYTIFVLCTDISGNIGFSNQSFSTLTTGGGGSGGGGGGFVNIPFINGTIQQAKTCEQYNLRFLVAYNEFTENRSWQTFWSLIKAFWNNAICGGAASIVPLDAAKQTPV